VLDLGFPGLVRTRQHGMIQKQEFVSPCLHNFFNFYNI
jgi:hypothetical protein